jgi:ankyrin repeat protein
MNLFLNLGAHIDYALARALIDASEYGCTKIAKILVRKGAIINDVAVEYACIWNQSEIVKLFIKSGYTLNDVAIYYIMENNNADLIKFVLKHNPDPDTTFYHVLKAASQLNNVDMINIINLYTT